MTHNQYKFHAKKTLAIQLCKFILTYCSVYPNFGNKDSKFMFSNDMRCLKFIRK